jgi:hypothetical protein
MLFYLKDHEEYNQLASSEKLVLPVLIINFLMDFFIKHKCIFPISIITTLFH